MSYAAFSGFAGGFANGADMRREKDLREKEAAAAAARPATSSFLDRAGAAPQRGYAALNAPAAGGYGGGEGWASSVEDQEKIARGIIATAEGLGVDPVDVATAVSYETAGTFDPRKKGPTTQWGQHRGLIQFGEPQAQEHGVNWDDPVGSQLGADGAVAKYLRKAGVQPGMGMLDIYSAINAGSVGRYSASDANNGGAPGTVRDKVEGQMAGHREKALAMLAPYMKSGGYGALAAPVGGMQ